MINPTDNLGWRAKVGLILPSVNTVTEPIFYSIAPTGITFHSSRTFITGTSTQDVLDMEKEKHRAANEFLSAKVDCLVDCCTASGVIQGLEHDKAFCAEIKKRSGTIAISAVQSVVEALTAKGIKRLVVVTPYPKEVDELEKTFFEENRFSVVNIKGLGIMEGFKLSTVPASDIYRICISAWKKEADGLFISCMNFNATPVIQALELALQVPVISSISATLWGILRSLGIDESVHGFGSLLDAKL